MPQPELINQTALSVEPMWLCDLEGRSALTLVCKATLGMSDRGGLAWIEEQDNIELVDKHYDDDPHNSVHYPSDSVLIKPGTDVILSGFAVPPQDGIKSFDAGIQLGSLAKVARIFGKRFWRLKNNTPMCIANSAAEPTSLRYENVFGGWDRSDADAGKHAFEARNPIGSGFGMPLRRPDDILELPRIENPRELITQYGQVVVPHGFGPIAEHWFPRAQFAGTYDEEWVATRAPLLPSDFDTRFFNAASPALVSPVHLRGDEELKLVNMTKRAKISYQLPGIPAPRVKIIARLGRKIELDLKLDTIHVDTQRMIVNMLWRNHVVFLRGPSEVRVLYVTCDHPVVKRWHPAM